MIPFAWLTEAENRISKHIQTTPLTYDPSRNLYLKWENRQITGSFKARGALNKVLGLEPWEQEAGLVAASAGNHGQGVALAGKMVGAPVKIFVSEQAPKVKVDAMLAFGAEVVRVPGGYGDAETAGLEFAANGDQTWISPYNDGLIIAGQGTIGLELNRQLGNQPEYQIEDSIWLVPASGGGLISGVGATLSYLNPKPKLVAVQSDTSPFLYDIFHKGSQAAAVERPTIADGLAGPVEEGSITIPMTRQFVDDFILVNEDEIAYAIAFVWYEYGERIEGAAAVSLAAVLSGKIAQRPAVVILSGGNINNDVFQQIIAKNSLIS